MRYAEFFNAIKDDSLHGAYILHGEEEYIKSSALSALYATVDPAAAELNIQDVAAQPDQLIAACETLPFFAERRIIVCRELPTGDAGAKLREYLPNIPPSSLLIFYIRGKADGVTALYKALSGMDHAVLFDPLTPEEAAKWVMQQGRKRALPITPQAARYLVDMVGVDLTLLSNEFSKAADYAGANSEITREVISQAVTRNIEYRIFDMVDCFVSGKAGDGMRALDALLLTGESPIGVAALLSSRFKLMLSARNFMDAGLDKASAAKKMGGSDFAAKKAYDSAKRYSRAQLLNCIAAFADVGYMQISGAMRDREALELALLKCALDA